MDTLPDDPLKVIFANFCCRQMSVFLQPGGRAVLPGPWRKHQEGSNLKVLLLLLWASLPKVWEEVGEGQTGKWLLCACFTLLSFPGVVAFHFFVFYSIRSAVTGKGGCNICTLSKSWVTPPPSAGAAEAHWQQPQQAGQQDLPPREENSGPALQPQPDNEGELRLRKVCHHSLALSTMFPKIHPCFPMLGF